jgi:hypothetical protein
MEEQYWDALTNRIQSAESFLRQSCYSHSPNLIERDMETRSSASALAPNDNGGEYATAQKSGSSSDFRTHPTTFDRLNSTIEDGRLGFKNLVQVNNMAVLSGPVLIGLAAISGIALQNGTITLIFGILGISVVISMFLLKPFEQIQVALANLIQAETVSTDFYNQVQFWAPYAQESASAEERQRASQALHEATTFALKALHDYVEPSSTRLVRLKEEL